MLTIQDPGNVLSHSQVEALTAKAHAYPFDIHVLIGTGSGSRAAFERDVDQAITPGSRAVSIGVDPTHHFSHVYASASLGLPSGPTVASAGNVFFRHGDLVEGIDAIAAKANDLQVQTRTVTSQTGMPIVIHEHKTAEGVWWALGGLAALVAVVVVWAIWRARRRDAAAAAARADLEMEAAELRSRNIEEQAWHDKLAARRRSEPVAGATPLPVEPTYARYARAGQAAPSPMPAPSYVPQAPQPVIINQVPPSSSVLDTMLEVEMIRDLDRDRYRPAPVIEREVVVERDTSSSSSLFGSDDSSSSSSWGSSDDSSSSSSFDSGGGGDSGGSSDW
jgi:uncharacterized membrane protein YgcG